MTITSLIKKLIGVKGVKIKNVREESINGQDAIIATVSINKSKSKRCSICHKKCPGYDTVTERRKWRGLDVAGKQFYIEGDVKRVECKDHGIHTEEVPWAEPNSRFTRTFEEMVTWTAIHLTKKDASEFMRINWRTVGEILSRTKNRLEPDLKIRWTNLRRIGIDETSYKKGHKYLTVVVDHDTNQVVWVAPGHDYETLSLFFKELKKEQRETIEIVSCDGAKWIKKAVSEFLPNAEMCIDPFHVVCWAEDAMDDFRKALLCEERKVKKASKRPKKGRPRKDEKTYDSTKYKTLQDGKYTLGKNPENLTNYQNSALEKIRTFFPKLYKAYELKEGLRAVFKAPLDIVSEELDKWLWWASHSKNEAFVKLSKKIRERKEQILATVRLGISNARIESTNNKIKVLIRKSYGFRNITNLVDMILLVCSNIPILLPYS